MAVHPLHAVPSRTGDPSDSSGGLEDHLDSLLGEQLLPVRTRQDPDDPYLLAVDASGQPVVVEVVGFLDDHGVLAALRHAGRAARMTTRDLAQAYDGGPHRFAVDLAAFRLTAPSTALLPTFVRGGARLVLVCAHVAEDMADVVEFLLQPGWQVDVLRVEISHDVAGRRIVDVAPLVRVPPRRPPRRADLRVVPTRPTVTPPPFAVPAGPVRSRLRPDPRLVALAEDRGTQALVWSRQRRGEHVEAVLCADGTIELADGSRHEDPDAAARAAGGSHAVDGWRVWRVGSASGPALADMVEMADIAGRVGQPQP